MTPKAAELSIRKLGEMRKQGHDPTTVIENAIIQGWRGLYAPHEERNQGDKNGISNGRTSRKLSVVERVEQNIAAHRNNESRSDEHVIDGTVTIIHA